MWTKLRQNFSAASVYFIEIFGISILFLVVFSLISQIDFATFLSTLLFVIIFDGTILFFIGKKRSGEINQIRTIIRSIRKSKFKAADEIKLSRSMVELEGEIKAMFLKTRNDIENLKKLESLA